MPVMTVAVESAALERVRADVLVVGVAKEDRPLRGAAGHADWRLCGRLSELVVSGRFSDQRGEASLVVASAGLSAQLVLVVGLGPRGTLDGRAWKAIGFDAVDRALGLRAHSIGLGVLDDRYTEDALGLAVPALLVGASRAVRERAVDARLLLLGSESSLSPVLRTTNRGLMAPVLAPGVELQLPGAGRGVSEPPPGSASPAILQGRR